MAPFNIDISNIRPNSTWLVIAASNFIVSLISWHMSGINSLASGLTSAFSLSLLVSLAIYLNWGDDSKDVVDNASVSPCNRRPLYATTIKEEEPVPLNLPAMPPGADKMTVKRTVRTEEIVINNDHQLSAAGDSTCDKYNNTVLDQPPIQSVEKQTIINRPHRNSVDTLSEVVMQKVRERQALAQGNQKKHNATVYRTLEDNRKNKGYPQLVESFTEEQLLPVHEISTSAPTILNELPIVEVPVQQLDVNLDDYGWGGNFGAGSGAVQQQMPIIRSHCPECMQKDDGKPLLNYSTESQKVQKVPRPQQAASAVPFEPTVDLVFKLEDARYRFEPEKFPVAFKVEEAKFLSKSEANMPASRNEVGRTHEMPYVTEQQYGEQPIAQMQTLPCSTIGPNLQGFSTDPCKLDKCLAMGDATSGFLSRFKNMTFETAFGQDMPSWLIQLCVAVPLILVISLIQTDVLPLVFGHNESSLSCVKDGSCTGGAGFLFGIIITVIALVYMYFSLH